MSWTQSLIKLAAYEVEVLQKRLNEIAGRRTDAETRLLILQAEAEAESTHASGDAEAGWYKAGYLEGMRQRRAAVEAQIREAAREEEGARDALAEAFENQKKYELVAENLKLAAAKTEARREAAQMDEMGLRRAAGGR